MALSHQATCTCDHIIALSHQATHTCHHIIALSHQATHTCHHIIALSHQATHTCHHIIALSHQATHTCHHIIALSHQATHTCNHIIALSHQATHLQPYHTIVTLSHTHLQPYHNMVTPSHTHLQPYHSMVMLNHTHLQPYHIALRTHILKWGASDTACIIRLAPLSDLHSMEWSRCCMLWIMDVFSLYIPNGNHGSHLEKGDKAVHQLGLPYVLDICKCDSKFDVLNTVGVEGFAYMLLIKCVFVFHAFWFNCSVLSYLVIQICPRIVLLKKIPTWVIHQLGFNDFIRVY